MQKNSDNGIVKPKQQKAIASLLTSKTIGAAAVSAGISERTLYKWMQESAFRAALREAESQLVGSAVRRLARGQESALDTLETLISKAKYERTKHAAAVSWLNLFLRFNEVRNIDERLTALEAIINDKSK